METAVVKAVIWKNRYRIGRDAPFEAHENVAREIVDALDYARMVVDLAAR